MSRSKRTYGARRGRDGGPPFVQIFRYMMESEAWRELGPVAQAVYLALKRHYNGSNNGQIGLSCRQAAEGIGMSYSTTSRAFKRLIEHGFIEEATKGVVGRGSGYNRATEWLLDECNDNRNGKPARKRFIQWSKSSSTVATASKHVAPLQRDGSSLSSKLQTRFIGATSNAFVGPGALHPGNTLTSSHGQGANRETRGAAEPHEQSKPRVACTGLGTASRPTATVAGAPTATSPIGDNLKRASALQVSAELETLLRRATPASGSVLQQERCDADEP